MAVRVLLSKTFVKKLRKLPPQVSQHIQNEVQDIQAKPHSGKRLSGKYKHIYSKRSVYKSVHYRVLYYIHKDKQQLTILNADTRQGVYKLMRQMKIA